MARKTSKKSKTGIDGRMAPLAAAGLAVAAGVAALLLGRRRDKPVGGEKAADHVPTDLTGDRAPPGHDDRVPAAFRPDMDAPMSAAERDAMRPATIGAPPRNPGEVERL